MNASELLNADVGVIGQALARGFRWWVEELRGLAGSARARRSRVQVGVDADGALHWRRDGAPATATGGEVDLVLAPEIVLERTLDLPPLSESDLRRLMTADIDRLTPFTADQVWFDALAQPAEAGTARTELAVVSRSDMAAWLAALDAVGARPARVTVGDPATPSDWRFDFLPAIRREGTSPAARRRAALVWGAFAILLIANLAALIGRDMAATRAVRDAVDAQRPTVALAQGLRRRVQNEETRRAALLARRERQEPLRILEEVSRALPPPQWVQRFEWNGRIVRLVGFKQANFDLAAALRGSPLLTNPRALSTERVPASANGEPFDITAELERRTP